MFSPIQNALALVVCLGAGIVGGVFFAFSNFVMKALAEQPAAAGVAAMQRINAVVINPLFLGVFAGTALFSAGGLASAMFSWRAPYSPLVVVAALLYLIGCFGVTIAFNVPRNDRLAGMAADSADAAAYWPVYVREWLFWNHVRTAASIATAGCTAAALAFGS